MAISNVSEISNFVTKAEEPQPKVPKQPKVEESGAVIASPEDNVKSTNKTVSILEGRTKIDVDEIVSKREELKTEKQAQVEKASIFDAIDLINQKIMMKSTNLVFEFDDLGDPPIVKVVDKDNGEVIREIPPKEMQEIAKAMSDIADSIGSASGILFDSKI